MVSGVKCSSALSEKYGKYGKQGSTTAYITAKIDKVLGEIVVDEAPEDSREELNDNGIPVAYEKMKERLIENTCGYAFWWFTWTLPAGGTRDAVVLIYYSDDDTARGTDKLQISTSKQAIVQGCPGHNMVHQANSKDDLDYHTVLGEMMKKKR